MRVCSKAASPWASRLHMTPKKDGTWRPCGDYRRLNLITESDHYAMPNLRSDIQHWYIPYFLQAGSFEGLLPSASQPSRCTQNSHHHSLWNICVPLLYIQATQQWNNLSENDGPDIRPSALLQSLH